MTIFRLFPGETNEDYCKRIEDARIAFLGDIESDLSWQLQKKARKGGLFAGDDRDDETEGIF